PLRELLARGDGRLEAFLAYRHTEIRLRRLADGVSLVRLRPQRPSRRETGDMMGDFLTGFPYGVVRVGNDGNIAFANPIAKALFRPSVLRVGGPLPEPWPSISLAAIVDRAGGVPDGRQGNPAGARPFPGPRRARDEPARPPDPGAPRPRAGRGRSAAAAARVRPPPAAAPGRRRRSRSVGRARRADLRR